MLQIVTEFCFNLASCKYFVLSSKVHAENISRRYMCVCIATAVDFSIQVQMNQWKIVWLPVWIKFDILLEVVLYLGRVHFLPNTLTSISCLIDTFWPGKILIINEPPHDKTNKMSVRPAKTQISLGIRPDWSESSLCTQWVAKDPSFLHADSEDSDQTGRLSRLIWVFTGRKVILLVLSRGGSNIAVPVLIPSISRPPSSL